jgi:hypothetical protein
MFYTGDMFPQWKNDFFFATLVGRKLVRVKLKAQEPLEQEFLLQERFGRLRMWPKYHNNLRITDTDAYGPGEKKEIACSCSFAIKPLPQSIALHSRSVCLSNSYRSFPSLENDR